MNTTGENPRRHLFLLISLLLIMIATPLLAPLRPGLLVVNIIGATVLIAGSYAISDRKHFFAVAIALSGASLIGNWFLVMYPSHAVVIIAHSCVIVLLSFFAITILSYVVRNGRVTADKDLRCHLRVFVDWLCLGIRLRDSR